MLDQTGYSISLSGIPERIVSLVPSQTELLFHLGLDKEVAGITKFCIHPDEWFRTKTRVGGTKQLDLDAIRSLQPDLILGNKEENSRSDIELLRQEFPVWMSDINSLGDALDMIRNISQITGKEIEGAQIAAAIESAFSFLQIDTNQAPPIRVGYLIWKSPWMAVGNQTFIHSMLHACGWINCFGHLDRYPEVSIEMIQEAAPDILLLSTEPFPFREEDTQEFEKLIKDCKCVLADGEYFSWYGSRLLHAPDYFRQLNSRIRKPSSIEDSK